MNLIQNFVHTYMKENVVIIATIFGVVSSAAKCGLMRVKVGSVFIGAD